MHFITTFTTVSDLSYNPTEAQQLKDFDQVKAIGRRAYKTLKGKGEAVWGPELERALLEAVEKYHEADRAPAYNKTGKYRSHKQVGSRVQRIRESCEDKRILSYILNGSAPPGPIVDEDKALAPTPIPTSTLGPPLSMNFSPDGRVRVKRHTFRVYVRLTINRPQGGLHAPFLQLTQNDINSPLMVNLSPQLDARFDPSRTTLRLSLFSNIVRFFSPWKLKLTTKVVIYYDQRLVRDVEAEPLQCISGPDSAERNREWIYEYSVAGGSWPTIRDGSKPSQYTVLQQAFPVSPGMQPNGQRVPNEVAIVYHFEVPDHQSVSVDTDTQGSAPLSRMYEQYSE
ncbi:hypothetical protein NMY22_g8770 [Coprinellus aureogranulatus]|nr:hypothetical protein NMY22_g8770 [Coprinellus aureogranulatus]